MANSTAESRDLVVVAGGQRWAAFPELERGGARNVAALRAAHLVLLLGLAVLLTIRATSSVQGAHSTPAAVRNIAGFTGIALLAAATIGPPTAWLPTVAFGMVAVVAGAEAGVAHVWAWPIHPNEDASSWGTALTLLIVGGTVVVLRDPGWSGGGEPAGSGPTFRPLVLSGSAQFSGLLGDDDRGARPRRGHVHAACAAAVAAAPMGGQDSPDSAGLGGDELGGHPDA